MDVNSSDHPQSLQAFTTFHVPRGLLQVGLIFAVVALVVDTLWEAITATGSFTDASGLVRAAVVVAAMYLTLRCARAGLNNWRRYGPRGGIGPAIERIEPH